MSDEEDVIDKLENESRKKNDDSDEESDEEYKIEEKEKDDDDEDEDGENKNKDKVDWRKATPEEVFKRFDEDNVFDLSILLREGRGSPSLSLAFCAANSHC